MSLISATSGSDSSITLSGSGFATSGSSGNPDLNFSGKTWTLQFRSVDQPNISWGFPSSVVAVSTETGFNKNIRLPKDQLPSGQWDIVLQQPNATLSPAGNIESEQASTLGQLQSSVRVNVTGSISFRTFATGSAGTVQTIQYEVTPAEPGGLPEFGAVTG